MFDGTELLLSIETATDICSVALHNKQGLIDFIDLQEGMTHSQKLSLLVDQLMNSNDVQFSNLDGVIVSKGPGSYTGLRIGVALAKGICFAHQLPLIGINTLQSMAGQAVKDHEKNVLYCPLLDARRMEVYYAVYDQDLNEISATSPLVVEPDSFSEFTLNNKLLLFGNGMNKCRSLFMGNDAIGFLEDVNLSARDLGYLGMHRYLAGEFEDLAYFEPFYVKSFQAKPAKKLI